MQYTFSEKLIWQAMGKPIFKWLKEQRPNDNIDKWKCDTKQRYKQIIGELDDIGSLSQNPLRISLVGGVLWIAIYETANPKMSDELFSDMVKITMDAPLVKKAFAMKKPFGVKNIEKKIEKEKITNSIESPFNWQVSTTLGRDGDEYTTTYHKCGLCALGKKYHHEDLIPLMCQMDYISIDVMGGVLDRTQTLASGGKFCDFHVYKKGSKWDK